jgi:glycosyltransferase involved in cell wall biosynthesis
MTERIRIAHVIDTLRPGGAEQLVLTTVTHLDPARFESMVVALMPPLDLRADFERIGVPVHHVGVRSPLDWRRGIVALARLLRDYRPHVVHTHLLHASFFGRVASLLARRPPLMTTLHHLDYTHWASGSVLFRARKLFERLAAPRLTTAYVAVSRAVRDDYVRHFGLERVHVIYNYLDVDALGPLPDDVLEAARAEFGWTRKEFVLVNVARLSREKGQRHLLAAMPEILRGIPACRLLIAGDGPERDPLEALVRQLGLEGVVTFAGNRRDVPSLLGLADVFVFPSVAEGLGIALLEAMAASRPVVASAVEGIAEIVENGRDGVLVPAGDPAAIVKGVLDLYADPARRRRLGAEARLTARGRFSAPVGVAQLSAIYETVATRSGQRGA